MRDRSPREFVIPAGHARLWTMRAGQRVTIAQTRGQQVGDFISFNAADLTEFLSPSQLGAAWPRGGSGRQDVLTTFVGPRCPPLAPLLLHRLQCPEGSAPPAGQATDVRRAERDRTPSSPR